MKKNAVNFDELKKALASANKEAQVFIREHICTGTSTKKEPTVVTAD